MTFSAGRGSSSNALRADARAILEAGVAAANPRRLSRDFLEASEGRDLAVQRASVVAVGKAAEGMTAGIVDAWRGELEAGVVLVPAGTQGVHERGPAHFMRFEGGHPIPDPGGVEAATAIRDLASGLGEGDLLLCLISGGASSLMTLPPDEVPLGDVQATTDDLLRAGATIGELNCVRKHLDELKGGRLARLAAPARVVALVLSDVIGDPLDVIASGPVTGDPTTFADAVDVLRRYQAWDGAPTSVREYLTGGVAGVHPESVDPSDPTLELVESHIVGNNALSVAACTEEALARGYAVQVRAAPIRGEARDAGLSLGEEGRRLLASRSPDRRCILAGGETTVTVRGSGKGGRNQELALGGAVAIDGTRGVVVASLGTDGVDGPTDAAGAIADGATVERGRAAGLDAAQALADNDSNRFFDALGDLIITGPTGTNVMDLAVVLVDPEA